MVEDDSGKVEIFMAKGNESDGGERAVENTTFSWMKTTPRFTFLSQELPSEKVARRYCWQVPSGFVLPHVRRNG
jgi:hypothetical protein